MIAERESYMSKIWLIFCLNCLVDPAFLNHSWGRLLHKRAFLKLKPRFE